MLEPRKSFQAADWTSPQKIGGRGFAAAEMAGVSARAGLYRVKVDPQRTAPGRRVAVPGGRREMDFASPYYF